MEAKNSILIVDDNVSFLVTMSSILKRKGYVVNTAINGMEAIEKAREYSFDIIFMDIQMPVMNGVETYKEIKKIRPKTTVIMMTAYAVEELIQEALQKGAHGVIYKPLDIKKTITAIDEVMKSKQEMLSMIIDDDPGFCTTLKNVLVKKGHGVGIAHNGEEGIAMVQELLYDIIFIDMKLPVMNGLETYLAIKNTRPQTIAIMMTGYYQDMEELIKIAIHNSAYACLYKPIDMEKMFRLVDEIREKKQKRQEK